MENRNKMKYNQKQVGQGCHALMKLKLNKLEKALGPSMPQPVSAINAIQAYRAVEKVTSEFIDTSDYGQEFDNILNNFKKNFKGPLNNDYNNKINDYKNQLLGDFKLSIRTKNFLKKISLADSTVKELAQLSEFDLLKMYKCDESTLRELKKILIGGGLEFKKA